jgi:hypothetical protein
VLYQKLVNEVDGIPCLAVMADVPSWPALEMSCLVIQCLIIECFAVAAYRLYLPVADPYAAPITAAVMADEHEHLNYGEQWLRPRLAELAREGGRPAKWCKSRGAAPAKPVLAAFSSEPLSGNGWAGL